MLAAAESVDEENGRENKTLVGLTAAGVLMSSRLDQSRTKGLSYANVNHDTVSARCIVSAFVGPSSTDIYCLNSRHILQMAKLVYYTLCADQVWPQ